MSLFQYLQLQEVAPEDANSPLDHFNRDEITLDDSIDGEALDRSWGQILQDNGSDT